MVSNNENRLVHASAGVNILPRNKKLFQDTISKNDQLFRKSRLIALYALINEYIGRGIRGSFLHGFCHIILKKKVKVGLPLLGHLVGVPTR